MSREDDSSIVHLRQLDTDIVDHLQVQYGMDMAKVLTLVHKDYQNGKRIAPHDPTIRGEVLRAVCRGDGRTFVGVILRRTGGFRENAQTRMANASELRLSWRKKLIGPKPTWQAR